MEDKNKITEYTEAELLDYFIRHGLQNKYSFLDWKDKYNGYLFKIIKSDDPFRNIISK